MVMSPMTTVLGHGSILYWALRSLSASHSNHAPLVCHPACPCINMHRVLPCIDGHCICMILDVPQPSGPTIRGFQRRHFFDQFAPPFQCFPCLCVQDFVAFDGLLRQFGVDIIVL